MALRLASDKNVHGDVVRGVRRHAPHLDLVRVEDVGLAQAPDPDLLEWAAGEGRVLITNDRQTMIGFAYDRVRAGQPMPGLLVLRKAGDIGQAIADIILVAECYHEDEMRDQVVWIPL
jgi:predicted nuclease of predicted toxin-antitoxin system